MQLKIHKVGDGLAIVLPPELLARLGIGAGDSLCSRASPDGLGVTLRAFDAELAAKDVIAADFLRRYRAALRELER